MQYNNKKFFICNCCQALSPIGDRVKRNGNFYCSNCIDKIKLVRSYLYNYEYKPAPVFFSSDKEKKNNIYYGMEIEVNDNKNDKAGRYLADYDKFFYLKQDSTIDGFEIVTHPATYSKWIELLNGNGLIKKVLNICKTNNCIAKDFGGLHIHTSKIKWRKESIKKLYRFFNNGNNKDFIVKLSDRKISNLNKFAKLEVLKGDNNSKIAKQQLYNLSNKIIDKETRHIAVNMTETTIEFRIFNSSLNSNTILKYLQFVDCLYKFCNSSSKKYDYEDYRSFIRYVYLNKNRNYYNSLYNFVNRYSINKFKAMLG